MKRSLPELAPSGKPLTLSLAAAVAAYYGTDAFSNPHEHAYVLDAVKRAGSEPPPGPTMAVGRRDDRCFEDQRIFKIGDPVRVFTDYELLKDLLKTVEHSSDRLSVFVLTEQREEADFLFLVSHVKNFQSLPSHQRINQFPFEGGLVRKVIVFLAIKNRGGMNSDDVGFASPDCEKRMLCKGPTSLMVAPML